VRRVPQSSRSTIATGCDTVAEIEPVIPERVPRDSVSDLGGHVDRYRTSKAKPPEPDGTRRLVEHKDGPPGELHDL
jgi:hypothetical protein